MLLQPGSTVALPRVNLPLMSIMGAIGKPRGHGLLIWDSRDGMAGPRIESRLLEEDVLVGSLIERELGGGVRGEIEGTRDEIAVKGLKFLKRTLK